MKLSHDRRCERGSAAVEFALVLPVLLLLIFGIIDFGRMLAAKITLTEAAREGARATALISADAGRARVAAATTDLDPAVTADITDCPTQAGAADDATAIVRYHFTFITPLGLLAGLVGRDDSVTLTATGVMPCLA
jgi:Flp pilus assembly protein TadG